MSVEKFIVEEGPFSGILHIYADGDLEYLTDISGVGFVVNLYDDFWSLSYSPRYSPQEIEDAVYEALENRNT